VNQKIVPVILLLVIVCILVVAAILILRKPIVENPWGGVPKIETTTPTLTLFPDQGWWTDLPTPPGLGITPSSSPSPTP